MSDLPSLSLRIEPGLRGQVRVGSVVAGPVRIGPAAEELIGEMEQLAAGLRALHAGHKPSEIEGLQPARELYRSFGVDPTKTRPSSEALLRRVLRERPLPRVFNAVDVCNLLSLRFLLPMGLYDAAKIEGDVVLRRGAPGESFAGIRKDAVQLAGRLVLADARGAFGNPTSDSLRTSVDPSTRSLWLVIFAPPSVPEERMGEHVERAAETMRRHLAGGTEPVRTETDQPCT